MNMIVHSVAYQEGQRLGDVTLDNLSEVVSEPGTFVWLELDEPDEPLLCKIQEEFSSHDLAVEDARSAHQQPKVEQYGESLFAVLKTD